MKKMKKITIFRSILGFILIIFVNGCTEETWQHKAKNNQQFYQDKIKCRTIASRATANIPAGNGVYSQQPSKYTINTESNGYGGYNSVVRTQNNGGGFLAGVAAADAMYPQRAYRETLRDCMRSKGWYLK